VKTPAVALIDGEHYPDVVRHALEELGGRYDFRAAVFVGGAEKIRLDLLGEGADSPYGLPLLRGGPVELLLRAAAREWRPEAFVDLSDEPVLGYEQRFWLICHALSQGVAYEGSDFRFTPPRFAHLSAVPSLSVVGTGKRVGKTAVSGHLARVLHGSAAAPAEGPGVVVVAMGRGGPAEPELVTGRERGIGLSELLELSRAGRHAASDHLEDAALSRLTTVGCRRCGGGMAGQVFVSNVEAGVRRANALGPWITVLEGSGAAFPPIATDARVLVASAAQPADRLTGYLGPYRVLASDAVVLTMCEAPLVEAGVVEELVQAVAAIKPEAEVVPVVFRPRPLEEVDGAEVAVFTTATANAEARSAHLEERYGCRVRHFSGALANRAELESELGRPEVRGAEVFLIEVKAAAIDLVAEEASRRGVRVVLMDNEPEEAPPAESGALEKTYRRLGALARERFQEGRGEAAGRRE
jgi:cyclic 2,3-diphosphoglycerate synthase